MYTVLFKTVSSYIIHTIYIEQHLPCVSQWHAVHFRKERGFRAGRWYVSVTLHRGGQWGHKIWEEYPRQEYPRSNIPKKNIFKEVHSPPRQGRNKTKTEDVHEKDYLDIFFVYNHGALVEQPEDEFSHTPLSISRPSAPLAPNGSQKAHRDTFRYSETRDSIEYALSKENFPPTETQPNRDLSLFSWMRISCVGGENLCPPIMWSWNFWLMLWARYGLLGEVGRMQI